MLVRTFSSTFKAGPAGGRLRRPSSAGGARAVAREPIPPSHQRIAGAGLRQLLPIGWGASTMDASIIAAEVASTMAPYLLDLWKGLPPPKEFEDQVDPAVRLRIWSLWSRLRERLQAEAPIRLDVSTAPDDADFLLLARLRLEQILVEDPTLANELSETLGTTKHPDRFPIENNRIYLVQPRSSRATDSNRSTSCSIVVGLCSS